MKRSRRLLLNRIAAHAIMIAAILLLAAGTAFAAVKLLSPAEVALQYGDETLAKAFESEDAILINETQEFEDYNITLLGIVSGEGLNSSIADLRNGDIRKDNTNAVFAIERTDGETFDNGQYPYLQDDDFRIIPMISGYPAYLENVPGGTISGYLLSEDDKVAFLVISIYNMEPFADHTLYLGVSKSGVYAYNNSISYICDDEGEPAYLYDEETGLFHRNEQYHGINALFKLPVDPAKADPEKAQAIMDSALPLSEEAFQELVDSGTIPSGDTFLNQSVPDPSEFGELLEGTGKVIVPDKDGNITLPAYTIYYPDGTFAARSSGQVVPMEYFTDYVFKNTDAGIPKTYSAGYLGNDQYYIDFTEVVTLDENGALTYQVYTKTTTLD